MTSPTTQTAPLTTPPPPVSVQDASVVLGSTLILESVSLTVTTGESVALLGANGSGKSTLVRTILGLAPLRAGSVRIFGADVSRRHEVNWARIGYVPQRVGTASGVPATALEVVRSGLLTPRRPWADRGRRAQQAAMQALDLVGLADRANEHVQVFSGGQAQRVMIARALVRRPDLLVLDEPLAGIDRTSRQALAHILTDLRGQGLTLLTVLHEMGELTGIVDRAVVLSEGRVVAEKDAAILAAAHAHHHAQHDALHNLSAPAQAVQPGPASSGHHSPSCQAHDAEEQLLHSLLGHDQTGDCEHHHPHGQTSPARHHSPDLSGPVGRPDQEATR